MTSESKYEEIYHLRITQTDLRQLHRIRMQSVHMRFGLLGLAALYGGFCFIYQKSVSGYVFWGFIIAVCIFYASTLVAGRKMLKEELARAADMEFEYVFRPDYFLTRNFRGEEQVSEIRHAYSDITRILRHEQWLLLQTGGRMIPVRRSQLVPNSVLLYHVQQNLHKVKDMKKLDRWWVASMTLFVATLASMWIALILAVLATKPGENMVHQMWMCYLVIPIPILSIGLSFFLKRKGRKYKKNLIAGIIVAVLLCIYGSFAILFRDEPKQITVPEITKPVPTGYNEAMK